MLAEFAPLLAAATQVTVLHVMSQIVARPGVPGWELRADAPALMAEHTPEGELLARDVAALQQVNQRVAACIRHGLVVDEILAEAANEYDLLVLGRTAARAGHVCCWMTWRTRWLRRPTARCW